MAGTKFAKFGHKWLCLHRGPVWQYKVQETVEELKSESRTEVNIIPSVLLESALNSDDRTCDNNLEDVNASLCTLSINSSEVYTCSTRTKRNEESRVKEMVCVPHLWMSVTESGTQDME